MDERFKHHPPKGEGTVAKHQAAREAADAFFKVIEEVATPSREKALSITKVEEAMFWLNADIARNQ